MSKLVLYPLLSQRSRTAIKRVWKRWGHAYEYRPRRDLVTRLSHQTGLNQTQVREQLERERQFILRHREYY